jgi:hypothetical protein
MSLVTSSTYRTVSPVVMRQKREANNTFASSAEVKNGGAYTSSSPYIFMAW